MSVNKRLVQMNNSPLNPASFTQVQILLRRTFQEQFRQSRIIITPLIKIIIMSVLIGAIFLKLVIHKKVLYFVKQYYSFVVSINVCLVV
jgi:hypothetical protein